MSNTSKQDQAYDAGKTSGSGSRLMDTGRKDPSEKSSRPGSEDGSSTASKLRNFPSRDSSSKERDSSDGEMSFEALEEKIEDLGKDLKKKTASIRRQIIHQIKQNPWAYATGLSVGSWIIGYFMGRRGDASPKKAA